MLGSPVYSTSKHAVVGFAEWLSATCRHRGVVVQAVCPQGVGTDMLHDAGEYRALLTVDGALIPAQAADAAWEGIQHDQFLILPHAEVATYAGRATNTDHWLTSMNRLQQRIGAAAVQDRGEDPA
jgi:NAD(P)-dependent dehydrogenase (short-subunit alcohol dehydrogenase family)